MTLRVWATPFGSFDLSQTDKNVTMVPQQNMTLKAIRSWFVLYNASFSNLVMKIYSSDLTGLIATSDNSWDSGDLVTDTYGYVSTYFEFDPTVNLSSGVTYRLVMAASGYTYSASAHLAWVNAFPDPIYNGYTPDYENALTAPYKCEIYADEYY